MSSGRYKYGRSSSSSRKTSSRYNQKKPPHRKNMFSKSLLRTAPRVLYFRPLVLPNYRQARPNTTGNTFPQKDQAADSFKAHKPIEALIVNDHRSFEELHARYHSTPDSDHQQSIIN